MDKTNEYLNFLKSMVDSAIVPQKGGDIDNLRRLLKEYNNHIILFSENANKKVQELWPNEEELDIDKIKSITQQYFIFLSDKFLKH